MPMKYKTKRHRDKITTKNDTVNKKDRQKFGQTGRQKLVSWMQFLVLAICNFVSRYVSSVKQNALQNSISGFRE